MAHLIGWGELERHLRRVRRLADYKRDRLARRLGQLEIRVAVTGLRRRGVLLDTLRGFRAERGPDRLLLDYGAVDPSRLDTALDLLAELVTAGR